MTLSLYPTRINQGQSLKTSQYLTSSAIAAAAASSSIHVSSSRDLAQKPRWSDQQQQQSFYISVHYFEISPFYYFRRLGHLVISKSKTWLQWSVRSYWIRHPCSTQSWCRWWSVLLTTTTKSRAFRNYLLKKKCLKCWTKLSKNQARFLWHRDYCWKGSTCV